MRSRLAARAAARSSLRSWSSNSRSVAAVNGVIRALICSEPLGPPTPDSRQTFKARYHRDPSSLWRPAHFSGWRAEAGFLLSFLLPFTGTGLWPKRGPSFLCLSLVPPAGCAERRPAGRGHPRDYPSDSPLHEAVYSPHQNAPGGRFGMLATVATVPPATTRWLCPRERALVHFVWSRTQGDC